MFPGLIVFLFGIAGTVGGIYLFISNEKKKKWPTTSADVLEKNLIRNRTTSKSGSVVHYELAIKYSYNVAEKKFISTQVYSTGTESLPKKSADNLLEKIGSKIEIHYDPKHPEKAYIFRISSIWILLLVIGSASMVVVGVGKIILELN